jgi:hypothetical protein
LIFADQSQRERVHQRIAGVTGLELSFAAEVRHAEAVAVRGDSADHAFEDRVIAMDVGRCRRDLHGRAGLETRAYMIGRGDRPEAKRIHHRNRPCAHGENIAQDSADTGGGSLKRFDERRMVM